MSNETPLSISNDDSEPDTPAGADQPPPFISVAFNFTNKQLIARITPHVSNSPPTIVGLQKQIAELGFDSLSLLPQVLDDIVKKRELSKPEEFIVGEQKDSLITIEISKDKMQAHISATPAQGGETPNKEAIIKLIQEKKIALICIIEEVVDEVIALLGAGEKVTSAIIAKGKSPENGIDSTFISLFSDDFYQGPQLQSDGTVDHYETHKYLILSEDTPLMKRTSATPGKGGFDVSGKTLPAKPGKELPFAKCDGAHTSSEHENILVATREGHPVLIEHGVNVDPTLQVKNVDLGSGNIRFDGSLLVLGDVLPKMSIEVSGDVFIKGKAEHCSILAGNNITIEGGLFQDESLNRDGLSSGEYNIEAGNDIDVLFMNSTAAKAGNNITLQRYALHCDLLAGNGILIGDKGGKGRLIGGVARADNKIEVNVLGSEAYIKTELICGAIEEFMSLKKKHLHEQSLRLKELGMLKSLLEKIKATGTPETVGRVTLNKARKINAAVQDLSIRLNSIDSELKRIEPVIEKALQARIIVNQKIFPNSTLYINDVYFKAEKISSKKTFYTEDEILKTE
jgi:uncharacterized protein (DUF342 family)